MVVRRPRPTILLRRLSSLVLPVREVPAVEQPLPPLSDIRSAARVPGSQQQR
ncbi:MAG TPA: hypothetical protein VHZ03_51185 [Trebonia sp.]|jgi:hypothetical protein|nr:hypothetical protein [Trebonia sp.]